MTKGQTDHTACPSCTFWKKASAFFLTIKLHLSIYVIKNAVGGLNFYSNLQLRFFAYHVQSKGTSRFPHIVLLPYGFTLFSNLAYRRPVLFRVSLPYGFTLFSNGYNYWIRRAAVSLPYGFTLFSNMDNDLISKIQFHYLMDLHYSQTLYRRRDKGGEFHYLMDLHYSQTEKPILYTIYSFTTLWIYTILKPPAAHCWKCTRFTTLWIYTILKL